MAYPKITDYIANVNEGTVGMMTHLFTINDLIKDFNGVKMSCNIDEQQSEQYP
jgi:hypothetical protein